MHVAGAYTIRAAPSQVLQYSAIGYAAVEHNVGDATVIDIQMKFTAVNLEAIEVVPLGQTAQRRTLGTSHRPWKAR